MSDFSISNRGASPYQNYSAHSSSSVRSTSDLGISSEKNVAPISFGDHFSHVNQTLLSQLDVSTETKPQRNLPFVQDAVAKYFGEKDSPDSAKSPTSFLSKWNFFSGGSSDTVSDYHALSRLYAAVYSQFPNEADVHIDHTYIDNLNHDVWNGGQPTEKELAGLRRQMNDLLTAVGVETQI